MKDCAFIRAAYYVCARDVSLLIKLLRLYVVNKKKERYSIEI